jgi:cytochrome P450
MARTCSLMKYQQWSSQGTRQRPRHCSGCARCLPIRRNGKLTPQKHQGSSSRLKGPRQAFRGSVYLGVVHETLRLYPPVFATERLVTRSDEICGTRIPDGSIILVPYWLLHRDPRPWKRPDAFDRFRFLSGSEPNRLAYLPFGIGQHVCIGAQLAISEATLTIARLVQKFTIGIRADRPVLPVGMLTTGPHLRPTVCLAT